MTPRPEIIAHRGASAEAPENTLASIQLAWQQHSDAAEIDVMLTSDGQIVAIHDETMLRTGGVDWPVNQHTLAELKTLDVGSWKSARFAEERIPTLAEMLDIVPPGKRLFIELKCSVEILPELKRVLGDARTKHEQIVLICLDFDTIRAVKQDLLKQSAFWVTEQFATREFAQTRLEPTTVELIERTKTGRLDGLDINDLRERASGEIAEIRQAGLRTCVWTVNSLGRALWLHDEGMESLTTDVPAQLIAAFTPPKQAQQA